MTAIVLRTAKVARRENEGLVPSLRISDAPLLVRTQPSQDFCRWPSNILGIQQKPARVNERASFNHPGDFLLSHAVSRAVPSAPAGLTSMFGMGTGVTLPTKSLEKLSKICKFQQ